MSLENILKKIIDDAQEEADRIILESQKKADEIKKAARKEAKEQAEAVFKESERKGHLEASRLVTQSNLEKKIKLLSCKKELIDEVLGKVFQKENIGKKVLRKKIVLKQGEREESFDKTRLKEELRPKLENFIAKALGI